MKTSGGRTTCLRSGRTCTRDDGGDRCEVHQRVVVRVEAVIQPDEAFGRQLGHAVVAGYQDVDVAPEAGPRQLCYQEADIVVNLMSGEETPPSRNDLRRFTVNSSRLSFSHLQQTFLYLHFL